MALDEGGHHGSLDSLVSPQGYLSTSDPNPRKLAEFDFAPTAAYLNETMLVPVADAVSGCWSRVSIVTLRECEESGGGGQVELTCVRCFRFVGALRPTAGVQVRAAADGEPCKRRLPEVLVPFPCPRVARPFEANVNHGTPLTQV